MVFLNHFILVLTKNQQITLAIDDALEAGNEGVFGAHTI